MSTKKTYVPPAKRQASPPPVKDLSTTELNDTKLFPSLKEGPTVSSKWIGTTFKEKIDNLIASEKMSEQEKAANEEQRRINEGWVRFPSKPTEEMYLRYKITMRKIKNDAAHNELMAYGYYSFGTYYIDGVAYYGPSYIEAEEDDDEYNFQGEPQEEAQSEPDLEA
jgi:hypothetical protein